MNRFFTPRRPLAFVLATLVGILTLGATPAQAAERAFFSHGTAQFVNDVGGFVGTGNATHLGLYEEAGSAVFTDTDDPAIKQVDAQSTYIAANGDELYAVISGHLNGLTGEITATVTYVGGTGRFAYATGTATLTGQLLPGGAIEVAVKGKINLP